MKNKFYAAFRFPFCFRKGLLRMAYATEKFIATNAGTSIALYTKSICGITSI